jgi:hypothetical protein
MQIIERLLYPVRKKSVGWVCRMLGKVHVWPFESRPYSKSVWLQISRQPLVEVFHTEFQQNLWNFSRDMRSSCMSLYKLIFIMDQYA